MRQQHTIYTEYRIKIKNRGAGSGPSRWVVRREWAPATAKVAYGARWIADFNERCSDVVPNRQGWAFDDKADRDLLVPAIDYLASTACSMIEGVEFVDGAWEATGSFEGANYRMLANGGYMHVEVWA